MAKYRRWLERPRGKVLKFDVDKEDVESIFNQVRKSGKVDLTQEEAYHVLEAYGIPMAKFRVVKGLEDVVSSAEEIGYPLVLKIADPGVSHKTEIGGVVLDIRDDGDMVKAFQRLKEKRNRILKTKTRGTYMVQEMVEGGQETIMGMNLDPAFGPLLMFGLGGIYVEYLKDVTFRILPLTDIDTSDMIRSIRGYKILEGVRGEEPSDINALSEAIARLAQLVTDFPQIKQLDVNPFIVLPENRGAKAVDARMSLVG
jgi:acyl-CoA synthetase (NDP forming)